MSPDISPSSQSQPTNKTKHFRSYYAFFLIILPVSFAIILYKLDPSDPVAVPDHHLHHRNSAQQPPLIDGRILRSLEQVGSGHVSGPEDLVYDPLSKVMYTGCGDGWIKRVAMGDGPGFENGSVVVEEVVNTGGRPLGLALSRSTDGGDDLIIADAFKGLLKLTRGGELVQLTKDAEGEEFKLTDGVDVAKDGTIYFTDASSKHNLHEVIVEHFEGRPNGRLLSFNPITGETRVLLRDLYFPNGLAMAPDQRSLIFCETMVRMCKRYHIKGTLAGSVEPFINNTFGSPDNIHYDGEGRYWIGLVMSLPQFQYKVMNYPLVRKGMIIADKYIGIEGIMMSAGVLAVDLEGNPVAYFNDRRLSAITSGIKIGDQLYLGSLYYEQIFRLNLTQYVF